MLVGLKTTLMVQLLFPASDEPQSLVCEKSAALVPLNAMLVMVRAVEALFVRVTACGALDVFSTWKGYGTDVGDTVTVEVPVPVRGTVCGLDPALSAIETVPVRVPVAVGVNVTEIVQLFFGPRELPQVFVWAKS